MDDTDRKLLILMGAEPRIHLRELANRLGISRQAVHHRMQVLTELGVITGATARVSIAYLDAVPVVVFGRSRTTSVEKTMQRLGGNELVGRTVVAGGNYFYVVGYLRGISELNSFVEFVKMTAEMPEPTVGIYCHENGLSPYYYVDGVIKRRQSYKGLTPLDLRIIATLKDNARKPVAEVADMLGVSTKTVRRRLKDMMSDGSVDMSVPADLISGGDLLLVAHVSLRDGADKAVVGRRLLSQFPFMDAYVRVFSNFPNLLLWVFWSDNIKEIRRAVREANEDENIVAVMLNFGYLEQLYSTWRDRLPEVKAITSETTGRKDKSSMRRKR